MSQKAKTIVILSAVILGIIYLVWRSNDGKVDNIIDPIPGEVINDIKIVSEETIDIIEEIPDTIIQDVERIEVPNRIEE